MTEKKVEERSIRESNLVIIIILIIIVGGVVIAIPIVYTAGRNSGISLNDSTVDAPSEYVNNECTQTMSNVVPLISLTNLEPFPYRMYNHIYRPSVILNTISLIFAFRHDVSSWSLDKISVIDTTSNIDVMQDGDFESNYLTKSYSQCILSNTRSSQSDILFDLPYSNDFYYNDQTNVGMNYLIQPLTIVGGRYYNISYYLENRGYANNSFLVLIGA